MMSYTFHSHNGDQKRVKVETLNPDQNSPIKEVMQPVYTHNWIGIGTIDRRVGRILFTPTPVTPTKHLDGAYKR